MGVCFREVFVILHLLGILTFSLLGLFLLTVSDFARSVYESSTSVPVPALSVEQWVELVVLLVCCPALCMWVYGGVVRFVEGRLYQGEETCTLKSIEGVQLLMYGTAFLGCLVLGFNNVFAVHPISVLTMWKIEPAYVALRGELFQELGFFPFVNLYLVVPLFGLLTMGVAKGHVPLRVWTLLVVLIVGSTLFLQSFLFQRKAIIMYGVLAFGFIGGKQILGARLERAKWLVPGMGIVILAVILIPFLGNGNYGNIDSMFKLVGNKILGRCSVPSMYYLASFDEVFPFYPVDWGGVLLDITEMPDDNTKNYQEMHGEGAYGTMMAPCYVTWYSQGGRTHCRNCLCGAGLWFCRDSWYPSLAGWD